VPARDGSSAADDATRKIEVQADPVTELSPTEVNLPHGPGSAARSPAEVPTGMIRNCPSVGESNRPAAPAESGPSSQVKPNRFTPLDTEGNQPDETASSALPVRRWERLEVGLLAIALLAIVVVVLWAAWPASADTLYRRIRATAKERGIEAAKQQIDEFVERFPADGRFEEVEGMKKDVECDWLQSRLALKDLSSGGSRLEPFERQFLLAMRLKSKDPESARAGFRSLVDEYPISAESPDALRVCVEAARHQLVRLGSGGKPP
jgi:TolA-binding protein